ncbi:Uncharacterised protein [Serratia quinivorans]|nr:Uncharacterised protein [Serratia quinivorans]CAI1607463.1 Uncharacterised protein [Serratia quinivorans]
MTLRLAEIERQQRGTEQAMENQRELLLLVNRVEDFAAAVRDRLDKDDFMMKREILRALVKRVEIYRDEIVVVFRVNPGNALILNTASDPASAKSMPDCLRGKNTALWHTFTGRPKETDIDMSRLDDFPQQSHETCVTDPAAYSLHQ